MRKLSVNNKNDEKKLKNAISKNISKLRKDAGLTQEKFAEQLDMDRVTVAYAETGKRIPKVRTLYKMSKILNVNISDFFKGL